MTTDLPLELVAKISRAIEMLSDVAFDVHDRRAVRALLRGALPRATVAPGPIDRLEEIDRAYAALLSHEAPKTWRLTRRQRFKTSRKARREMHARELGRRADLERRAHIGGSS